MQCGVTFLKALIGVGARVDQDFDGFRAGSGIKRNIQGRLAMFVEKFGIERLASLTQSDLDARVKEFINLASFDISLVS